jgi:hypothetical protein
MVARPGGIANPTYMTRRADARVRTDAVIVRPMHVMRPLVDILRPRLQRLVRIQLS